MALKEILNLTNNSGYYTEIMKTQALNQALKKYSFDFIIAGARRDEEVPV